MFQIDRQGSTATLHFTPVNDYTRRYHIIYGYEAGDQRFGLLSAEVSTNSNNGVQSVVIDDLDPALSYWFVVAPVNGCAVGEWSNWLEAPRVNGRSNVFYRWLNEITS